MPCACENNNKSEGTKEAFLSPWSPLEVESRHTAAPLSDDDVALVQESREIVALLPFWYLPISPPAACDVMTSREEGRYKNALLPILSV